MARRRVEASNHHESPMTESTATIEARVTVHWPEPNSGCQKMSVPGASYPSEAAGKALTRAPPWLSTGVSSTHEDAEGGRRSCEPYRTHTRYTARAIPPTMPTKTSHGDVPSHRSASQPRPP